MMVRAAVLVSQDEPLEVREVVLPEPGPGQVRVRVAAAGVCHSDLSLSNGALRQPVPAVLGHEGAGTVVAVGADVTNVGVGDSVLLNWTPACRACWFCEHGQPYLCEHASDAATRPYAQLPDGTPLYAGLGTAAFAEQSVVAANAVLKLPDGTDLEQAAVVGCAVITGVGAVLNTAHVQAGESVCVVGLGGVGLSVLQGARLAGAGTIIAVDTSPAKEELALACGASAFLPAGDGLAARVRELTDGRGVDHAFECVGRAQTTRLAWDLTRRGGRTTVVGVGRVDDLVTFSALELFFFGRTISGCVMGSSDPERDAPALLAHAHGGRLDLDTLVTHRIGLDDIPDAFDRMRAGEGGRSLVVFS